MPVTSKPCCARKTALLPVPQPRSMAREGRVRHDAPSRGGEHPGRMIADGRRGRESGVRAGAVRPSSFGLGHLLIEKPPALAVVCRLWSPVIVEIKHLARVCPHPIIVPSNAPRTATCGRGGMGRTHVPRHATAPGVVVPLAQLLRDLVRILAPDKPVWTTWLLLQRRFRIELDLYGFTDEFKWSHTNSVLPLWADVKTEQRPQPSQHKTAPAVRSGRSRLTPPPQPEPCGWAARGLGLPDESISRGVPVRQRPRDGGWEQWCISRGYSAATPLGRGPGAVVYFTRVLPAPPPGRGFGTMPKCGGQTLTVKALRANGEPGRGQTPPSRGLGKMPSAQPVSGIVPAGTHLCSAFPVLSQQLDVSHLRLRYP
jgi:hypothetical protein